MLTRAPLSGAILVSPGPKLHSVKTWGDAGGGVGWHGEELLRIEQFAEVWKPDLSYLIIIIFIKNTSSIIIFARFKKTNN